MSSSEAKTVVAADRFRVLRRLGEGGMGAVYEVLDQEQDRRCALKVLKRREALDELRFRREFREIAGYHHPNLVRLFDLVKLPDGHLGYTMELIEGGDLWSVLCEGAAGEPTSRSTAGAQFQTGALRRGVDLG
jgi:serine/threonine protein kinase